MTTGTAVVTDADVEAYDFFMWDRDDDFHAYALPSPAAEIAGAVMRVDVVDLFFDHLLVQQPRAKEPTPSHHDLPSWPVSDDQGFEPIPDIEARHDEYRMLTWDLEPGHCRVHHALTVHGAPGTMAPDRRRRGLSTRWTGPDVRHDPHPGTFRLLREPEIAPGAPMECELFPRFRW